MISYKNNKVSFILCLTSDSLEEMRFYNCRIYFFQVSLQLVSLSLSIVCILSSQYIPKRCVNFRAICHKFSRGDNGVDLKIMLSKQKAPVQSRNDQTVSPIIPSPTPEERSGL